MKKFFSKKYLGVYLGILSLIFTWLVWIIAHKTVKNEYLIPSFSQTIRETFKLFTESFFWNSLLKTLIKVLLAFTISFFLALLVAGLGKINAYTRSFFKPLLSVIRTLPTMAVLVLILIYTNKTTAPVVVASLVLFPMIYAQFTTAFDGIDDGVISAVKVFKISSKDSFFKVYLPLVAPSIVSNTGTNLSFTIKLVVSAEIMAYTYQSLGGMMQSANAVVDVARLMALTLIAVVLGLIVELVFHLVYKHAFAWTKGGNNND